MADDGSASRRAVASAEAAPRTIIAAVAGTLAVAGAIVYVAYPASAPATVAIQTTDAADDPHVEAARAAVEAKIKSGMRSWSRGDMKEGHDAIASAVETARHIGVPVVLLEALCELGSLSRLDGDLAGAEATLTEAVDLAERIGNDTLRRRAITELVTVLDNAGKPDERLRKLAKSVANRNADRNSQGDALELEAANEHDVAIARKKWDDALVFRDKVDDLVARSMNRMGLASSLFAARKLDEARAVVSQALDFIDSHGGTLEEVARSTSGLLEVSGQIELAAANYAAVEAVTRRDIALANAIHGGESPLVANDYWLLGSALLHQHRRDDAEAAFARAIALAKSNPQFQAGVYMMMAVAYHDDPALSHEAVAAAEKGIAVVSTVQPADHPQTITMRVALCKLLVADHQLARARAIAEPLVAKLADDPVQLADVRFVLVQSLPASERARARKLAEQARDAYMAAGAKAVDRLTKVQDWLADPK